MDRPWPQLTPAAVGWGLLVLGGGVAIGLATEALLRATLKWRGRSPSAANVFGRLSRWLFVVLGFAAAMTVVFPSVRPVDVLGGVTVLTIAAGIAFQTVLGNMFAGIVLLSRDHYRVGDQIAVADQAGTVTRISLSATSVRTFDGRMVIIPNGKVHQSTLVVQTGYEQVRTTVAVAIDINNDPDQVQRVAEEAMAAVVEVLDEPPPKALLCGIDRGSLQLELRFWSGARQLETREARHHVIVGVRDAFRAQGVTLAGEQIDIRVLDQEGTS